MRESTTTQSAPTARLPHFSIAGRPLIAALVLVTAAATVQAQPTISSIVKVTTNLPSGSPGDTVRATVTNTPAGTYNNAATIAANTFIEFYNTATNALVATIPVSSFTRVAFPASNQYLFNLPVGLTPGNVNTAYNVVVRSQNDAATTFSTETNPPPVTFTVVPGAGITSISPAKAPVNSTATITVVVSNTSVSPGNTLILTDPATNAQVFATNVQIPNATTVQGTFNTSGFTTGLRHLTVRIGAQDLTALNAVEITPAVVTTPAVITQSSSQPLTFTTTSGTFGGTTTVNIAPATGLTLGPVVLNSANQVSRTVAVDAAAATGVRTVTVVHGGGAITSTSTSLTIIPAGLTVTPNGGRQGSQVPVALTGSGVDFTSGVWTASVAGGGVTAGAVAPTNATNANVTLTILASAATGTRVLQVTNGVQTLSAAFEILPVTITLAPTGATSGQDVTLNITGSGTNFNGTTTVSFAPGDVVLLGPVTVTSATSLSVPIRVPANAAAGPRTVTVATGALEAPTSTFQVLPVSISVAPASGNLGATTLVTVTGTNTSFAQGVTTVSVSGVGDVTAGLATVTSPTTLTVPVAVAMNATAGVRTLTVTTGSQIAATNFSIGTPGITLSRNTAQQTTNFTLAITGTNTNFAAGQSTVSVSGTGVTATAPVVTNNTLLATNISVAADAPLGARTLTVQTGQQVLTATITVTPPGLTISPTSGNQGQTVTLNLTRSEPLWVQGTTVALVSGTGVTTGPVTVLSPTSATVTLTISPNATPGERTFTTQTGATSATTVFTVLEVTPLITGVTPANGAIGTSLDVVINTLNTTFSAAAPPVVSFGQGVIVNSVTVNSPTQITARVTVEPNAVAGPRNVTVQAGALTLSSAAAFTVGTAITGGPFQCRAAAGVPPIVRAEGLTELVGDLVVVCTGGTAGEIRNTNLQLFLNTNITSRIVGSNDESEALLILDENVAAGSGSTATTPGIFRARKVTNAENAIVWTGVPIVAPGPGQRVLRFTNIRANAAGLGSSSALIPTQIVAFISASPTQSLAIDNPQQVVAYIQRGVVADLRACNGTDSAGSSALNLLACVGQNNTGNRNLLTEDSGNMQFALRFREGFQTAFKPQIQVAPGSQIPSVPGTVYHSESGFVLNTGTHPFPVGGASTGTRLMARFANIPANVRLFVTTGPSYGSSSTVQANLVQVAPGNITQVTAPGITGAIPGDKTLFCANVTGNGRAGVEVPVVDGTATAIWEVTEANPSANETLIFGVAVAYTNELTAGRPQTAQTSVTLGFAPAYAAGSSTTASSILPIPRFVENTTPTDSFRIDPCTTTLLFPYVASVAGFDTGLAISNTSRDPFAEPNRRLQSGNCTLHFYGSDTNGVRPPSQRTTRPVEPGETLTMVLSTGGGFGLLGVPNFQGYLMAQCDFQFAHGFAFLTDGPIGAARVAEGYLALVLDGGAGRLRGSATAEVRGK